MACFDEPPEVAFEQAIDQIPGITAQTLALAFQGGADGDRELLGQLKNFVFR